MTTVGITGHRPDKLGGYKDQGNPKRAWVQRTLVQLLRDALEADSHLHGITGMAQGADQDFGWACVELGVPFVAAIPFEGQERIWPREAQVRYWDLRRRAADEHVVCDGEPANHKLMARNQWVVSQCDRLLAVWDGSRGGTKHTIQVAWARRVPVIRLDPLRRHVAPLPAPTLR